MLVALLCACAQPPAAPRHAAFIATEPLPEPGDREVVVVINANSFAGSHAGLFAGRLLYDPSGTYAGSRAGEVPGWPGPSLTDYVAFHLRDGPDVRLYRFGLAPGEFADIQARIGRAGWTLPMFCARDVQDVLAGIGPFRDLPAGRWISPLNLGNHLAALAPPRPMAGDCGHPEARPC